eukprot:TRINITY_DN10203_c0_g1_i1.p1 TRINITY_DN10203_c0_g1~~TRINITY_DN10203_c0_g1_i1.p1  ORF type:complete len:519 (-),score=127.91 TRINITY_DN10203_c0_g1_i1:82-1638(-)
MEQLDSSLFFEDKTPSSSFIGNKRNNKEQKTKGNKRIKVKKDEEELQLERELFGNGSEIIQNFGNDKAFSSTSFIKDEYKKEEKEEKEIEKEKRKEAVWNDEDDEEEEIQVGKGKVVKVSHGILKDEKEIVTMKQYEDNLRNEFKKKTLLKDDWANKSRKSRNDENLDEEDDDEGIQRTTMSRMGRSGLLESGELNVERTANANNEHRCNGITSVRFHPKNSLLSIGSKDSKLLLFQIDGKKNPLVSHLELKGTKIYSAEYGLNAHEILLSGNQSCIYSFDLSQSVVSVYKDKALADIAKEWKRIVVSPDDQYLALEANKSQHVPLLSNKSKKLITKFTMKTAITNTQFTPDGNYLTCSTAFGDIYRWDLRMRRCVDKSNDNGQLTRALAYSKNGSYLASGSENGIVQVYQNSEVMKTLGSPIKQMDHLVTEISEMKFNHDSQILATRSAFDSTGKNGLRLYHVPTFSAFSNFPSLKKFGLVSGKINSFDFSANSGFLATASESGIVSLFRLLDYSNA